MRDAASDSGFDPKKNDICINKEFLQHDAITGTSKQAVSDDYERRLLRSLKLMDTSITYISSAMFWPTDPGHTPFKMNTEIEEKKLSAISRLTLKSRSPHRIAVFNSLPAKRRAVVDLLVDAGDVIIKDKHGEVVQYQASVALNPQLYTNDLLPDVRVTFFVDLDSLGFKTFSIEATDQKTASRNGQHNAKVQEKKKGFDYTEPLIMENSYFRSEYSPSTGSLQSIVPHGKDRYSLRSEFKRYETTQSGAYLFRPSGIADFVPYPHDIRLISGQLFSELHVTLPGVLRSVMRMYHSEGDLGKFIEVENTHNLEHHENAEVALRFNTDLNNNFTLYTDSNGFQMVKRRASHDLPMQANYFPATTMAFLQDESARFTIHLGEAHGIGSQDLGQIEVMIDRRTGQDDSRGVDEALWDLRTVRTVGRIQLETDGFCRSCSQPEPTTSANRINLDLNHPVTIMVSDITGNEKDASNDLEKMMEPLPCNTHLLLMKPLTTARQQTKLGAMLHRFGTDCDSASQGGKTADKNRSQDCHAKTTVNLPKFLKYTTMKNLSQTTFNFVDTVKSLSKDVSITLVPKKIVAFTFDW